MKNFKLENLVRASIKRLKPYSSARNEFMDDDREMVFLDANENPFDNGVNRYPDPQQLNLKSVLAEQKGINARQIVFGNGSDEILDLIFRAFCEPNKDNVITLPPTYGMYGVLAGTNAITNREVLLTKEFQPDLGAILERVDKKTKLVFLCSPNNPTANLFENNVIESLLNGFNGLVVIDEAYIDFSPTGSWIGRLKEFPNLIVTQTFSKAYGMAGIRLGACYASMEIIKVLNRIKPPYNVNELTQRKALERIMDTDGVAREVQEILLERDELVRSLDGIPCIDEVFRTDSNFVLVRVDDADKRYAELIKKGIVVRNRSSQPRCNNALRFTVGTKPENQKLIKALKELNHG